MRQTLLFFVFTFGLMKGYAQSYTSYFTGDESDVTTAVMPGIVLMGGASESDDAMIWFLQRAAGGDILVIRASGSDGYNDYFFSELGVPVNSVETIVFNDASAAEDAYVLQQLENCEALWIAGGDQWDYVSYWKDSSVGEKINYLINEKKITVGGTSAGCAIQGDAYFSAENGTVTTSEALNNPYAYNMTIGYNDFLAHEALVNTITDSHYDNPDRRGRHVAFLARLVTDFGITAYGIGVDEYTAVCIDENKIASVFGEYPDYEDFAYFLRVNCIAGNVPEICIDGEELHWLQSEVAIKTAKVGGTVDGDNYFDINTWEMYSGEVVWENWWVEEGVLKTLTDAEAPDCDVVTDNQLLTGNEIKFFPNPAEEFIVVQNLPVSAEEIQLVNMYGSEVLKIKTDSTFQNVIYIRDLKPGLYIMQIMIDNAVINSIIEKL